MCCAAEADATAGDEEEEGSNKDEVEEELMPAPPLRVRAGALGGVRHKARRHQLQCGGFRGGEDENTLGVSLLGSAADHGVVVSLVGDEPDSLLKSSPTARKLVLRYSLRNGYKSEMTKLPENHLQTDVGIGVDVKVWWGVASISNTNHLHLLPQLKGKNRSAWKANALDGKTNIHCQVPVHSFHFLPVCENASVSASLTPTDCRHNQPANPVSIP